MKRMCFILSAAACMAANAATYWLDSGSNANLPSCFTYYSDEAMSSSVSVTPTANDGNTYVVLGSGKMGGTYTAPAGTTWIFGRDGTTVGTKKSRPEFNLNGYNQKLDFGNCTIYGIKATVASDNLSYWNGVNTLVNCGLGFVFTASSMSAGKPRGVTFGGTFIAGTDVLVNLGDGQWGYDVAKYTLSGTFSAYKGKFDVLGRGCGTSLLLTSASAFGDSSTAMTDYLTIRSNVTLSIDPAVTQYETKGIAFSLGADETAYISVDAAKPLTLIAPIYGSSGTFAKTGDGTLTLATSVETENISVDAGTLVVDSTASFAPGTTLKVKSGATVVSRVGSTIPNVTLDLSDGGSFTYDFTVPFDGTSATTMDYTSLTAGDRALLTKPIAISLSQKVALPQNTALNLAVARFSASAGFEAADFSDGTEKTYGLPNTSFSMSAPENGVVTLTMAVRPAITRTGGDRYAPLYAQYTYANGAYTSTPVWSDGREAHDGADYVHANGGTTYTHNAWDNGTQTFAGDSLYLTSVWYMKSSRLELPRTTFAGGYIDDGNGSPALHEYAGGPYILSQNLTFYGNAENSSFIRYSIEAPLQGAGTLTLSCRGLSMNPSFVTGDNSLLKGKVVVTHQGSPAGTNESARLEVAQASSLGGAMDAFAADGIKITKYSIVRPQQTMTLEAVNRGITIDGYGGFEVAADRVLTIANPVLLAGASGELIKTGAGSLKIDGNVTREGANAIAVREGWLCAPSEDVSTAADVSFASGTGLEIDVESVSENGLYLTGSAALSFADAKLPVRFTNTVAAEAARKSFSVAICTLPPGTTLMEGSFDCGKPCKGFALSVVRNVLDGGYVRFLADFTHKGLAIIIR